MYAPIRVTGLTLLIVTATGWIVGWCVATPLTQRIAQSYHSVMLAYSMGWGLLGIAYVAFGVLAIVRRDTFAKSPARFHQRIAARTPWLYPGGWGTTEREWRLMMIPIGVIIIVVGLMAVFNVGL
jgi:hypothetical protein